MANDDDDDFYAEFSDAKANDEVRPYTAKNPFPLKPKEGFTRCMECGRDGARMRSTPDGRRLVCTGVFEGEPPRQIDCCDRIEREQAFRNGDECIATRTRIRAAKEQGELTDLDIRFLRSICGGQVTIDALEARFAKESGKYGTGRPPVKPDKW